jgi:tripartite-type tricarboxylate transporter receptor subunit TctC
MVKEATSISRRDAGKVLSAMALAASVGKTAFAQQWAPLRPMKLIVPFPPGGTADLLGRLVAQHFAEALGQPTMVENRGGAGTLIGTEALIRSAPGGHTSGSSRALALRMQRALRTCPSIRFKISHR